jgi:RNA polymerase sigma factor (TIGR02999 family)
MEPESIEPTSPEGAPNARVDLAKAGDFAPLLYAELRALAGAFMRSQSPGHTLQPTALVNEAYIRLAKSSPEALRSRSHFLAVAAKAMRHVLTNHALTKMTLKRGGDATRVSFDSLDGTREYDHLEIMAIHETLERLEELDPRRATVVEAKVFGGLTNEEVAEVLGVSTTTVESEWRTGRAWLAKELRPSDDELDGSGSPG